VFQGGQVLLCLYLKKVYNNYVWYAVSDLGRASGYPCSGHRLFRGASKCIKKINTLLYCELKCIRLNSFKCQITPIKYRNIEIGKIHYRKIVNCIFMDLVLEWW